MPCSTRSFIARLGPTLRPHLLVALLVALLGALLGGCAGAPPAPPMPPLTLTRPIVLLGEVHDNAWQHDLRRRTFQAWLAQGARPALLMEQFDRDLQGAIDALRAGPVAPDADAVIAVGKAKVSGWDWSHYRPFVALALQYGLPIVAANVSRDDAHKVIQDGLAAAGFDANVPADVADNAAAGVLDSHCGMIDEPNARRMSKAQIARDQFMARTVEAYSGRGVLLLAGNGHVRTDVGVPRWLSPATRARTEAIGLLEPDRDGSTFDRVVNTPAQPRKDPCAELRKRKNPLRVPVS